MSEEVGVRVNKGLRERHHATTVTSQGLRERHHATTVTRVFPCISFIENNYFSS